MRFVTVLLLPSIALTQLATAQSPASAKARPHASAAVAPGSCVKVPPLSPKIPALPASASCAKPLYTITSVPNVKLSYASPMEGPGLAENLGIESNSFSLGYVDTKIGAGELVKRDKWLTIQYDGYLVDGLKFDSSRDTGREPFNFHYGGHQVIAGWDTGFAGMRIGGKRRLFIPFELAYGPTAHGSIPAKSELIFDVELVGQSNEPNPPQAAPVPPVPSAPTKPV